MSIAEIGYELERLQLCTERMINTRKFVIGSSSAEELK